MVNEGTLLGICNPLLDISANVDAAYLETYGLEANNAILAEDKHLPIYDDLVKNHKVDYIAGGAGQNSIRVAQWMLGSPKATGYIGCIGKDEFGKTVESCAQKDGVDTHYRYDEETPTGSCAVLITGKNRSLVANLAAANCYKLDHLKSAEVWSAVTKAQVYYVTGFFWTVCPEGQMEVAKHAAAENKVFTMNLSAPFLIQFFTEHMKNAMPYWDYIFANESEAATLSETLGYGTSDVKEIAKKLQAEPKENSKRPRVVVFTQGAQGTIVCEEGGKVTEHAIIPIAEDAIVDTNGAGDAFVGGFLAALSSGKDLGECVKAGHWSANLIIQRSGCSFPEKCEYSL